MSHPDPILTQVWLPGRGFVTYPAAIEQRTPEQLADEIIAAWTAIDASEGPSGEAPPDRDAVIAHLRRINLPLQTSR
jgi:hypothetical protein